MANKGRSKRWVQRQLNMYNKALNQPSKLSNKQLLPRKALMEKILMALGPNPRIEEMVSRLQAYWKEGDARPARAAFPEEMLAFESANNASIPDDLRYYFLQVNGMIPSWEYDQDQNGFNFWTLSRVRHVVRGSANTGLFTFCDYLSSSWEYAIKLVKSEDYMHVFLVNTDLTLISSSFSEFLVEYLANSPKL